LSLLPLLAHTATDRVCLVVVVVVVVVVLLLLLLHCAARQALRKWVVTTPLR
jgi:hypothetical protein